MRLNDAARALWRATLVQQGLDASDEQVELLLEQASAADVRRESQRV